MKIWSCKIGETCPANVPHGGDLPMRQAVEDAYRALTGDLPDFCFSGWGAELTESERAVVEKREPSDEHHERWDRQAARIAQLEEALRLTQEYVGDELLPPLPGWAWYDALHLSEGR